MHKLLFASLIALGISSQAADARRMPVPQADLVLEIQHHNKVDTDLPESQFVLRADGTWTYVRTVKQAIAAEASGQLARGKLQRIRALLAQAPWRVTTQTFTCMAFASSNTQFRVHGRAVWTEEMCSGERLDRRSLRRLAQVKAIVEPLLPPSEG
jgi:hypothetical protein